MRLQLKLSCLDAIRGGKERVREPYMTYGEWVRDKDNKEVRQTGKSYIYENSYSPHISSGKSVVRLRQHFHGRVHKRTPGY